MGFPHRRSARACSTVAWKRRPRFLSSLGGRNRSTIAQLQGAFRRWRRSLFVAYSAYARNPSGPDFTVAADVSPAFQKRWSRHGCRYRPQVFPCVKLSRIEVLTMEHFTGAALQDQPPGRQWSVDPPFDARVRELIRAWGAEKSPELIEEMIVTALKIARDQMSTADLKLINRSVKEMRYAAKVFARFQH